MKLFWKNIGKNSYALLLPVFLFLSTLLIGGSVKAAAVKPDQRVWESLFQLEDIRSLSFSGSVSYAGKARASFTDLLVDPNVLNKKTTPKYETVIVDFNGGNQILTPTESQSWFTFSTKTSDKKAPSFGIEVRSVGGKAYVAITGGTNLPAELSGYLNTWVQLDFDWLLKDLNLGALLANKTGVQNRSDAEKAEMQRMRSAILKSKTLTIRSKNIQKINGVYFDVYSFSVNKNNLKKLLAADSGVSGRSLTARQLSNLQKEIAAVKNVTGKIWVNKKDNLPYQINITAIGVQPKEKTSIQILLKDFNQPVVVSEPTKFVTLEELFTQLFPGMPSVIATTTPTSSVNW